MNSWSDVLLKRNKSLYVVILKKKKQVDFWITSEGRETEKSYIFF